MKMNELNGRLVKIGPRSITVKDDSTGKTCGVVRNVCTFNNLHLKKVESAGIEIIRCHIL